MKYLVLTSLVIFSFCSCGQHTPHGSQSNPSQINPGPPATFPTVGFEQSHEVMIPFSIDKVWPLLEPNGRHLIYDWWNPTVLREGKEESLIGQVTVTEYHSHEIFLIVTKHNPEQMYLQYLVLWDDFELQRIDITCKEGATKNSTIVVWTERNAGIHENGVSMVSEFVQGGHLVDVVERYSKQIEEYLKDKK
ncbi:MAG: hypothetical protein AAF587_27780 [Bacteroidota bacterium]